MASKTSARGGPRKLKQWQKFASEFRGHSQLNREVLYSLPLQLIRSLRTHAPAVLTADDATFETRLRQLSATGFYRKQPMFSDVLDGHLWGTDEFERAAVSDWEERESLRQDNQIRDLMSSDRPQPGTMDLRSSLLRGIEEKMRNRMRGYAGWLVTHPAYWYDVATLFRQVGATINRLGEFPTLTRRFAAPLDEGSLDPDVRDAHDRFTILQDRWSLSGFTTIWIPEPIRAGITPGDRFNPGTIKPDGLAVFLPWPMLVDNWLTIKELYEYHKTRTDLAKLNEWLEESSKLGPKRCARMMDLHLYREIVISSRYVDRIYGNSENIDRAFAAYFDPEESDRIDRRAESVRKLTGVLRRRMANCEESLDQLNEAIHAGQPSAEDLSVQTLLQELEASATRAREEPQPPLRSGSSSRNRRAKS